MDTTKRSMVDYEKSSAILEKARLKKIQTQKKRRRHMRQIDR